jgi:hypothetical protein
MSVLVFQNGILPLKEIFSTNQKAFFIRSQYLQLGDKEIYKSIKVSMRIDKKIIFDFMEESASNSIYCILPFPSFKQNSAYVACNCPALFLFPLLFTTPSHFLTAVPLLLL